MRQTFTDPWAQRFHSVAPVAWAAAALAMTHVAARRTAPTSTPRPRRRAHRHSARCRRGVVRALNTTPACRQSGRASPLANRLATSDGVRAACDPLSQTHAVIEASVPELIPETW